ncbi:MAG: RNA-directed DNA polymerase [Dehalococcoidia bacterium]|nr:RNA-directed DNA polymerase [Dehalococcoidia bacterium]
MTRRISKILNLEKAYDEVLRDERHGQDFLPDILHFLDTKKFKGQLLQQLKQELDNNKFQVMDLIKMDVPKDSFFIRPGARPYLRDLVLYRGLANYIGLRADRKLGSAVFSSRFDHTKRELFHWSDQWLKFERAFWVNFESGFKYLLRTDVTAYFANIGIERLRNSIIAVLDKSEESDRVVNFLFSNLIRPWAEKERNKGFGLPQGGNASPILANLFLSHVDALLSRNKNLRYLRYSDDIRILAKSRIDAKIALKTLIGELRRIGLDLNEKKTQILASSEVEEQLRDPRRQDMDTIQTILSLGDEDFIKKLGMPLLNDLFQRSFDSSNAFADRHLRFAVNCFVRLREIYGGRDKEIEAVGMRLIDKLEAMPGSADTFSRFFSVFPQDIFKKKLVKFLKGHANIYEWQEMCILGCLLRFQPFSQAELHVFRDIAFDKDKHSLTRSKALLLLGKFGNEHERYHLMNKFNEEADYLVKRAMIVATQKLSIAERSDFYSMVKKTDQEQAELVDHIKSLKEPTYFDDYVPSPISPIEEQY